MSHRFGREYPPFGSQSSAARWNAGMSGRCGLSDPRQIATAIRRSGVTWVLRWHLGGNGLAAGHRRRAMRELSHAHEDLDASMRVAITASACRGRICLRRSARRTRARHGLPHVSVGCLGRAPPRGRRASLFRTWTRCGSRAAANVVSLFVPVGALPANPMPYPVKQPHRPKNFDRIPSSYAAFAACALCPASSATR